MVLKKYSSNFARSIYSRCLRWRTPKALENFYSVLRKRGLEIVYLVILFSLAAGVVNAVLEGSKPAYINAIILHGRSAQTMGEAIMNFLTITVGTMGIYLIYQSGRQGFRRRATEQYLVIGFILLLLAVFIGFALLMQKGF